MQTGYESLARTEGYEIFDRHSVEEIGRARRRPGPDQALRPPRPFG